MSGEGKLGKQISIFLKLTMGLAFGLGMAFLIPRNTFVNFIGLNLVLLGGVLAMVCSVLNDVMEVKEAIRNNDLRTLADMRDRAYLFLVLGNLLFIMFFVIIFVPLISIFGLTSYVSDYIFLISAIIVAVMLTDSIYIIIKASPGADKWWEEVQKACELGPIEQLHTRKDEDNRGGFMR